MKISRKYLYSGMGVLLGLAAPTTHILFQMVLSRTGLLESFRHETGQNGFWISWTTPFIFGIAGFLTGLFHDRLREQKERLEILSVKLRIQSNTDELTQLYNRRHILAQLECEMERARRYRRPLSVLMTDVDRFKEVNDRYGHLAGDSLLREMGRVLKQSLRRVDMVGRYGGDEFLVILPESDPGGARIVAERIQENFRGHQFTAGGQSLPVTLSIGLFSFQELEGLDMESLVQKVDQILLQAKRSGKNVIFTASG